MSKNNSINFWRFVFTMSIVVFHASGTYKQLNSAYNFKNGWRIAVEYFFVVSGFLLAYKCENSELTAWEYTKHRFKRFYPPFLFTLLLMAGFRIATGGMTANQTVIFLLNLSDELLLVQSLALNYVTVNGPTWYISSLLICGYFIFFLLRRHKEMFSHFIAPLVCIVAYSYLNKTFGRLCGNVYDFSEGLGLSIAIIRGFGGMCAGVISYELYKSLKNITPTKLGIATAHLVEIAGFTVTLVYNLIYGSSHMDFIFLVFFIICTAFAFSRKKKSILFNNAVVNYLAKISFSIYLIHSFILAIFGKIYSPEEFSGKMFLLFLLITVASGALCDFVCSKTVAFIEKKSKKVGVFFINKQDKQKAR